MATPYVPLAVRFWARVERRGPDECWTWTGYRMPCGYGQMKAEGRTRLTHRVAWYLTHGAWPTNSVDHRCHNEDLTCPGGWTCPHRACVNPAHLEDVTQGENLARSRLTGHGAACKRGHPWSEENTYVLPSNGKRYCRACRRYRRSLGAK